MPSMDEITSLVSLGSVGFLVFLALHSGLDELEGLLQLGSIVARVVVHELLQLVQERGGRPAALGLRRAVGGMRFQIGTGLRQGPVERVDRHQVATAVMPGRRAFHVHRHHEPSVHRLRDGAHVREHGDSRPRRLRVDAVLRVLIGHLHLYVRLHVLDMPVDEGHEGTPCRDAQGDQLRHVAQPDVALRLMLREHRRCEFVAARFVTLDARLVFVG